LKDLLLFFLKKKYLNKDISKIFRLSFGQLLPGLLIQDAAFYNIKLIKAFYYSIHSFLKADLMKTPVFKLLLAFVILIVIISGCNGTRRTEGGAHNRGVNNSYYRGY